MIFAIHGVYKKPQPIPNKTQTKSNLETTPLQKGASGLRSASCQPSRSSVPKKWFEVFARKTLAKCQLNVMYLHKHIGQQSSVET